MKTLFTLCLGMALLSVGCEDPRTAVRIPDARPRLSIANAPEGATLYLDGKAMGSARLYDGAPGVLPVEVGTHLVEVKAGERLLLSTRVFLGGGELRVLTL